MTAAARQGRRGSPRRARAVLIWGSFLIITRFAVQGSFTVAELLLLRLVPAAMVLAPVMWRDGVLPRGLSWPRTLVVVIGAGIGFPAILMAGLQFAPASDAGALAPGMLPFWTALVAAAMLGEVPGPRRRIGLGMILAGAMMVSLWQILVDAESGAWRGHLCFLTAAALWAGLHGRLPAERADADPRAGHRPVLVGGGRAADPAVGRRAVRAALAPRRSSSWGCCRAC